jgi:DNA-binding CsgD family transcriptional regulator
MTPNDPSIATLRVLQGDTAVRFFDLKPHDYLIGRAPHCDVPLIDPSVSREHARLVFQDGTFAIEDLRSRHGVFVGAERVARARLEKGSVIRLGNLTLQYLARGEDDTTGDILPTPRTGVDSLPNTALAAALDRLQLGVLLTTSTGLVMLANRSAHTICAQADGLSMKEGHLRAASVSAQAALRGLLADDPERGGALSIRRPSLRRPFAILVTPLGEDPPGPEAQGAVKAVFLSDPERGNATGAETLQGLYELTPAEAGLAVELLQGRSVEEGALALGIRVATARTHLKRIFTKTGSKRQSDLVRLLLSGPIQLRED